MLKIFVSKDNLPRLVDRLMADNQVLGPVREGEAYRFRALKEARDLDLNFQNTRLSPKDLMHPQTDPLFAYSLRKDDPEAGILKELPRQTAQRVVLGIRPCDAKAFQLVDVNFVTDTYRDPWWEARRNATVLVGLGCTQPCSTCFCTAVGTGPFDSSALDVLMTEVEGGYLLAAVTEKGEALLQDAPEAQSATGEMAEAAEKIALEAAKKVAKPFVIDPLKDKPQTELFGAEFWEEVQFACINCGTCTYLCPTCWCFDIQDEVQGDRGVRLRLWDACMFPLFTLHGSGHNPRSQKLQRVRQRFMHKFKYYVDKYGDGPACVGCGRCVQYCPVNIDIRRVVAMMSASCVCPT
ncbi:4Fe-4S dicluster domain-containing protein [Desulfacinum hydrothermale DSM 13146]|uniref:4Fe-4S dicluster domain-containing protein n=1 Tax=Desulfacinum hydrothermale DSM 13146 TaxID=1121390 RepID=A0A1W1XAX4_9BACT|nr:4Fe-4S dicluster domain-containing protein [Desulfacinum hydrothermale]SMC20681.1 4Fe-4S dicluster domain-containing protein [Desulfacinum hydrothermale DSM 13146]